MAAVVINLADVNFTYFDKPVLTGLNWEIQSGQKIGLVGANGAGKSTVLKLILGNYRPESGSVFRQRGLAIGYLPQDVTAEALTGEAGISDGSAPTVLEAALSGSRDIARLRHALDRQEALMGEPRVYGSEARLARVVDEHAHLLAEYESAGGLTYENRVCATLRDLGLSDELFDQPVATLSGGQAKLVGLARLIVWAPHVLLLDEPDNHLDLNGKAAIERLVRGYAGAVIIVSHDRYLLDEIVDRIAELDRGQVTLWPGNYSHYAVAKKLAALRQEQLYRAQQKRIQQIEAAIKRFEEAAAFTENERHARQARHRRRMLDRMDKVDRPGEQRAMRLDLGGYRGSNKVLELSRLEKWFSAGDDFHVILDGADLTLWHGERVGLVGANGTGKSVLLRCVLGAASAGGNLPASLDLRLREAGLMYEAPDGGNLRLGPSVKVGYYAQQHQILHPGWTLIEEIRDARPMYETDAVAILQRFLFDYQACTKQILHLSGGERSRLQLAKLMLSDVNFLLLDEPTNNLDIPSSEVLETALADFNGSVLVISHDRYFLDRVVDRIAALEDGRIREVLGGYSDYMAP